MLILKLKLMSLLPFRLRKILCENKNLNNFLFFFGNLQKFFWPPVFCCWNLYEFCRLSELLGRSLFPFGKMSTCCLSLINDAAGTPYDLNESRSDIENNEANASTDAIHSQQGEQTCIATHLQNRIRITLLWIWVDKFRILRKLWEQKTEKKQIFYFPNNFY